MLEVERQGEERKAGNEPWEEGASRDETSSGEASRDGVFHVKQRDEQGYQSTFPWDRP